MCVSSENLIQIYPMFHPRFAVCSSVEHHRLYIVHRPCELRFWRLLRLKFEPQIIQFLSLFFRKHSIDAIRSFAFTLRLCLLPFLIVCIGISGIDFHQIMDQKHTDRMKDINFLVRILTEQDCHNCHMPRVLRIILLTFCAGQIGLSSDKLLFVNLTNKIKLLIQALLYFFIHIFHLLIDIPILFYNNTSTQMLISCFLKNRNNKLHIN